MDTVTVYVPAELTVIHFVVAPVLHLYEESPDGAHKEVDPPEQIVLLPVIEQETEPTVTVLLLVI